MYQLDVKSAFLHRDLNEAVFIKQPLGYEIKEEEEKYIDIRRPYMDSNKLLELGTTKLSPTS